MDQDFSSFKTAKSIIEYFASDKTRYPFWIIMETLRASGLDALEAAGHLLKSEDDDEVILALQILDSSKDLSPKFLSRLEACMCHENVIVRLAAVDPILKNSEFARSTLAVIETWIIEDKLVHNLDGPHGISSNDLEQLRPMCRLLAVSLSSHYVGVNGLWELFDLNFRHGSLEEAVAGFLAFPVNLDSVVCDRRILALLFDLNLVAQVARSYFAMDDSWYKIHACRLLSRLVCCCDASTIVEVRTQLDDFDPFVVRAAEETLAIIERLS